MLFIPQPIPNQSEGRQEDDREENPIEGLFGNCTRHVVAFLQVVRITGKGSSAYSPARSSRSVSAVAARRSWLSRALPTHPVVRSRRPSCRPDLRASAPARAAAVRDARRAPPQAARSILDGCEHDGTINAETNDEIAKAASPCVPI